MMSAISFCACKPRCAAVRRKGILERGLDQEAVDLAVAPLVAEPEKRTESSKGDWNGLRSVIVTVTGPLWRQKGQNPRKGIGTASLRPCSI